MAYISLSDLETIASVYLGNEATADDAEKFALLATAIGFEPRFFDDSIRFVELVDGIETEMPECICDRVINSMDKYAEIEKSYVDGKISWGEQVHRKGTVISYCRPCYYHAM